MKRKENERNIVVNYDQEKQKYSFEKSNQNLHPNFQIAPIALRRNDIISYSTTPVQNKQILFWKFIYNSSSNNKESTFDNVLIQNLDKERIQLKTKRRIELERLANSLKINVDKIPSVNTNDFDSFIKSTVRKLLWSFRKKQTHWHYRSEWVRKNFFTKGAFWIESEL